MNLSLLNLSNTKKIKELPANFGKLANLTELILNSCSVYDLKSMKNFRKLRVLELRNSKIKKLPSDIGNCQNLEKLCLDSSSISTLPISF